MLSRRQDLLPKRMGGLIKKLMKEINNPHSKTLTIVVCTNRFEKVVEYIAPTVTFVNLEYKILILLDSKTKNIDYCFVKQLNTYQNVQAIICSKSGLSNLRNLALSHCDTKYILFIDDDVTINYKSIKAVEEALDEGNNIVGLQLRPPCKNHIKRWFFTENQYHFLGLHSKLNNSSIWGACMAFNIEMIKKIGLRFRCDLDRWEKSLLSGGDTTFINILINKGVRSKLLEDFSVIHNVDKARLGLIVFARRIFWQGITESIRQNIRPSIIKELRRNFQLITIKSLFVGIVWFIIFLLGVIYGLVYRKRHIDSL